MNDSERAKLLEHRLHTTAPERLLDAFASPLTVLRTLFNEVSLTPYTGLVDRALVWLDALRNHDRVSAAEAADFLTGLLRLVGRHLTAYDLITFHHRGANYPDALLLDALLKSTLSLSRSRPDLFRGDDSRLRRRGLRQGWLLRTRYEGLPVPELPTSQGENQRVLPEPFHRVPEEQILQPLRRRRLLFADDPLAERMTDPDRELLRFCLADLSHPAELREVGTALFLDRPLGAAKPPLEPDLTPMLSHVAFSRSIASQRLDFLETTAALNAASVRALRDALVYGPAPAGVPLAQAASRPRPGTVALADALQVADDFLLLHTTGSSAARLRRLIPFRTEPQLPVLILSSPSSPNPTHITLTVHDAAMTPRWEWVADVTEGYVRRAGVDWPARGVRVLSIPSSAD